MAVGMRRNVGTAASIVAIGSMALASAACGDQDDPGSAAGADDATSVEIWVPWAGPDFDAFELVIEAFEDAHPEIDVQATPGIDSTAIVAGLEGGDGPDVLVPQTPYDLRRFCQAGTTIDLGSRIEADGIDQVAFTGDGLDALAVDGVRCALPYLADDFGLYYNRAQFEAAGITEPPRTLSELTAVAEQLTVRAADGTIERAGFVPLIGFYENYLDRYGETTGFTYLDGERSTVAEDPAVAEYLEWQRDLVDFYGYDDLVAFTAGAGDEFSADNGFQQGRISMVLDGEWRTAFIEDQAPELDYATAPFPASDDRPELYGSGMVAPGMLSILDDANDEDAAWELVKFLATDVDTQVAFAGTLHNLPTLQAAEDAEDFAISDQFRTFFEIADHPESGGAPLHDTGVVYLDLMFRFTERWQSGEVAELEPALDDLAAEIDEQLAAG